MTIKDLFRWGAVYAWHSLVSAMAGSLPTVLYFGSIMSGSGRGGLMDLVAALSVVAAFTCLALLLPFCALVALPVAIIAHRFIRLSFLRMMGLALLLTAPAILYLDYYMYSLSGPDSGPPTEPYSLSHLAALLSSPTDLLLMVGVPVVSALLAAAVLWRVRFAQDAAAKA